MLWILIKKQLLYMFSGITRSKKTGRRRKPLEMALVIVGVIALACMVVASMSMTSYELATQLIPLGYSWIYFAINGTIALSMSIVICMFMAYNLLYGAKDNDILLAMPINTTYILVSRIASLYLYAFLFSSIIIIPTFVFYCIYAYVTLANVIGIVALLFVLPLVAVTISCILGYFVALIMPHVKRKSMVTTITSLIFFALYYIGVGQFSTFMDEMMNSLMTVEEVSKFNPFYVLGQAFLGEWQYLLSISGIILVLFALIYFAIGKSYFHLSTAKTGGKKVAYKSKSIQTNSYSSALFKRELRHFVYSPTYLLNSGIGAIFILVAGIFIAIKADDILNIFGILISDKFTIAVIAGLALQYITSATVITAPSVSLEAKTINVLRALPIKTWDILFTKIKLHLSVVGIPSIFTCIVILIVGKFGLNGSFAFVLFSFATIVFGAVFGLFVNLLLPRMQWSNETEVVKRSGSVVLSLFSGWVISGLFTIIYLSWLEPYVNLDFYFYLVCLFYLVCDSAILLWLMKKGTKKFEEL